MVVRWGRPPLTDTYEGATPKATVHEGATHKSASHNPPLTRPPLTKAPGGREKMHMLLQNHGNDGNDGNEGNGGGDKLPGQPYPGPHPAPTPDGGPGVPNPPKAA